MTQGLTKKGKIWSLEPDQEIVLKQIWASVLKYCGYDVNLSLEQIEKESSFSSSATDSSSKFNAPENIQLKDIDETISLISLPSEKIKATFIHLQKSNLNGKSLPIDFVTATNDEKTEKQVEKALNSIEKDPLLAKYSPYDIHQAIFCVGRNDLIDNTALRYVRARKFHFAEGLKMLVKCLDWRYNSHPVDKWLFEGDKLIMDDKNMDLINSFKLNQAYLRGYDKRGCPIVVVDVQKHIRSNCPDKDFERLICLIIEWARLDLKEYQYGSDGASILFDMSGFSMKNADFCAIKFLVSSFEANYPECLSHIWIHRAPWIFNTAWRIIKPWLDPVVASKITFTSKITDLEKYIDSQDIPKKLGGKDDFNMVYIEPTTKNSSKRPIDETYNKLIKQRETLAMQFVESTINWIEAKTPEDSRKFLDNKIKLSIAYAQNFIMLDPYVRSRGIFDRNNQIRKLGI